MKRLRWTTVASTLAGLLASSVALAAPPTWKSAEQAVLPSGGVGFYQGQFSTLACASGGNCVASGLYLTRDGTVHAVVDNEVNGAWRAAEPLSSPVGASTSASMSVYGASCPSPGSCVLVGSYQDTGGNVLAFAASSTSTTWSTPRKITLPANAPAKESGALLRSVHCASVGNCTAVGSYLDADVNYPHSFAMGVSEVNGTWRSAVEITLPSDANANSLVTLNQLSCASAGNCAAVGSYVDHNNVTHALVVNQVNGVWKAARALVLPGNASAYAGASLSGVTCTGVGQCVAVGVYNTVDARLQALASSEVKGTWQRGQALQMPTNALANPKVFFYGFGELACSSSGNCATGGQYRDNQGNYQGFVVDETNGHWRRASEVVLPSGALYAGQNGGVVALSCPAKNSCRAGAAYVDASGNYQALTLTQTNSKWLAGQRVALPNGATSVGVAGGLYGLVCSTTTTCSAIGSFIDSASNYQGFALASR
ncbi:MAG TPA: hypothetical protein VMU98_00840 [Acidimicrobiales bacterium]|nr:hypothetical protein [Acidimicrobiales bacterium]